MPPTSWPVVFACAGILALCGSSPRSPAEDWTPLLDKNLSQWEMYLSFRHKQGYDGKPPTNEKGEPIQPIGYNKNVDRVFTVVEENGEPILRVSGGCSRDEQKADRSVRR